VNSEVKMVGLYEQVVVKVVVLTFFLHLRQKNLLTRTDRRTHGVDSHT